MADVDYEKGSARVQINRIQAVEAGCERPVPVELKVDPYVSGPVAWNLPVAAAGATPPAHVP